jgi:puromycin-sensitive aminopeptidase
VALIVGEFEATSQIDVDGTPVRIWAPPGKIHMAEFAKLIARHSLEFFNKYYGIKYPGDKLDLIAIPDFAAGAMENLGAVTFRETALLVNEKTATHAELERVADVVAHELAHMWFGDLTTMKWWNGIWLNEAFATFMELLAVDSFKPQWKRWESFGIARAQAFAIDGLKSTRTIEFPVYKPEEAQGMFDILTYQKGASVLRMLEQYLGAEDFRRGICLYLNKHKFGNTETEDLWQAIEEASKQPVAQMMNSWIFQEGHPLVSVELDQSGKKIIFRQQRFSYNSSGARSDAPASAAVGAVADIAAKNAVKGANAKQTEHFQVPVMFKVKFKDKGADQTKSERLLLTEAVHELKFDGQVEYVVVNEGGHGFYRVRYTPDLLNALTYSGSHALSAIERFNLVGDTWSAVLAGMQPLREYLELLKSFQNETDKNVWTAIIGSLHYLERVTSSESTNALKKLVKDLCEPAFRKLGWHALANEDDLTKQLRGLLASTLGTIGDDHKIQKEALELYSKYKADNQSVSADVVPALVSILAQIGGEERYQEFENQFKTAASPQEEDRYMHSLAAFRKSALLQRTLDMTLNGEIRTQNAPFVLRSMLLNTAGGELAWQFIAKNWQKICEIFPESSLSRMADGITGLVSEDLLRKTREFFAAHPVKQGKKQIEQCLEKQAIAISFKNREEKTLASLVK